MKPADSSRQMMLSIGALLASEREKRGLPVERAAKETRMRPQRIRDMENDDLSYFSDPSYARMFLVAYAKYLDIPMQTIREHLPDLGEPGTEGYQYINAQPGELPSLRRDLVSRPLRRSPLLPTLALVAVILLVIGGGIFAFLAVNADRITASLEAAAKPEPTPQIILVEPPPKPITLDDLRLSNLRSDATEPTAFDSSPQMAAPPTPVPLPASPVTGEPPKVELTNPASAKNAVAPPSPSPASVPATDDPDRAFLLGSSPEQTMPAVEYGEPPQELSEPPPESTESPAEPSPPAAEPTAPSP